MGNFIDLTNKVFGELTVIKREEDRIQPSGQHCRMWLCKCKCGNECIVSGQNLRNGHTKSCGHIQKESTAKAHKKDLIGMTFGELTVVEEAGRYISPGGRKRITWKCVCSCGKETIVHGATLLSGKVQSCGHIRRADLSGQQFGWLIAIKPGKTIINDDGKDNVTTWLCHCTNCGGYKEIRTNALTFGATISDGCINSINERVIIKFLSNINVKYKKEYTFNDLRMPDTNTKLRFDFAIFDERSNLKGLIEYDGIHHFKTIKNWGDRQRLISDPLKIEYCKNNNIPLLKISCKQSEEEYKNDILEFLKSINVSYVNPVPSS